MTKLLYIVSHPIQYQAPLLRLLAADPDVDLNVIFLRIPHDGKQYEPDFAKTISWDVPLLEGYKYELFSYNTIITKIKESDVIWMHGWQGNASKYVMFIARIFGRPILMRGENNEISMPDPKGIKGIIKKLFMQMIIYLCYGFLYIGKMNKQYYINRGVSENRLFHVPYAVDNCFFMHSNIPPNQLKCKLGIDSTSKVILYSGKLMRRKHPELLLSVWNSIKWNKADHPYLVFVGDGEMRKELEDNSNSYVKFLGFCNQSELPSLYAMSDVFVLPSEKEPWGLAVNEAMAAGVAVVVSDQVGCFPDLIDDKSGAVFKFGDASDFANKLYHVVNNSEEMGGNCKNKIENFNFATDIIGLKQAIDSIKREKK